MNAEPDPPDGILKRSGYDTMQIPGNRWRASAGEHQVCRCDPALTGKSDVHKKSLKIFYKRFLTQYLSLLNRGSGFFFLPVNQIDNVLSGLRCPGVPVHRFTRDEATRIISKSFREPGHFSGWNHKEIFLDPAGGVRGEWGRGIPVPGNCRRDGTGARGDLEGYLSGDLHNLVRQM